MIQPSAISRQSSASLGEAIASQEKTLFVNDKAPSVWVTAIQRRWRRRLQRRKVGRAYDMAREISNVIPANSRVLDVGCGNGFIAHHLTATVGASVLGIDMEATTDAPIDYRQFDGKHFPVPDGSTEAVLFCYVLHHAQDVDCVMNELRRVLTDRGVAVIYEDIPEALWDRFFCWSHNLKWRNRTGPCTFRNETQWRRLFSSAGFEIVTERPLSRWRNLTHPVRRRFYTLRLNGMHNSADQDLANELK
jgi:ubiquinone/menaquinone biosynthesis C-methylase UbiE